MFVFKAAVVGAGTMGGQIAQTIAAAGIPVVLKDIDDALVQAGLDEARNVTTGQIGKLAEKGKITAEQADEQIAQIVGRIHGTTSYAAFGDVVIVIEAVPERMEIKQVVFSELHEVTPGDIDAGIEAEKRAFATVFASEDAREGISAFLHKCPPRFQGK